MKVLGSTRTWDSETGLMVDAKLIESEGRIFLLPENNRPARLLEKDASIYKILSLSGKKKLSRKRQHLVIEPTMDCNLKCPNCFTFGQKYRYNSDEFKEALKSHRNCIVSISGGEPTLHKDILQIISLISERNTALLASNGLLLSDKVFLMNLKKAGLRNVTLSFNGFSEKTDITINGKPVLKQKLEAIDTLIRFRITFLLSMLLVRDTNSDQIGAVVDLAAKNSSFIKEVRIRSLAKIGKYIEHKELFMSDMLDIVCENLNIQKTHILKELRLKKRIMKIFPWISFKQQLCSLSFHLHILKSGKYIPPGYYLKKKPLIFIWVTSISFISYLFRSFQAISGSSQPIWSHNSAILKISLRVWPDKERFEYNSHHRMCASKYAVGPKRGQGICFANITADK